MIVKRSRHHHTKRRGRLQDIPWLRLQCSTTMDPNASNLTFQERNYWLCVKNISISRLLVLKRRQQISQWTHLVRLITICGTMTGEWIRLTASNFGKMAKHQKTTPVANLVKSLLYSKTRNTKKFRLGCTHELDAQKAYWQYLKDQSGCQDAEITNTGLIIDTKNPCLACSPDTLVNIPGAQEPLGIAECNCPYSLAHSNPPQTAVEAARNNKKFYC